MRPDREKAQQALEAQKTFDDSKMVFRRIVRHPLLPQSLGAQLIPIISSAQLLSDKDFVAAASLNAAGGDTPETAKRAELELMTINGLHIPPHDPTSVHKIIFRRSALERSGLDRAYFNDLFAEELAHSYSSETQMDLADIPDASFSLRPFPTKEELLNYLSERHEVLYGEKRMLQMNEIYAVTRGFSTNFSNRQGQRYEDQLEQHSFEELRSALLQTIFQALIEGTKPKTKMPPEEEFMRGIETIVGHAQKMPSVYYRELAALGYLHLLFDSSTLRSDLRKLILNLGKQSLDEFMRQQSSAQSEAFMIGSNIIYDNLFQVYT